MHVALIASIAALGFLAPQTEIWTIAYLAAVVAFFSASLDIAMDAYRREILPDAELGLGNSFYVNAYRISSLVPGLAGADPRRPHAVERRSSSSPRCSSCRASS